MQTAAFAEFPRGTLTDMLLNSYAAYAELVLADAEDWRVFDDFVYGHLAVMERCGFVSVEAGKPVGFITWDPRGLPQAVEIGHNCILPAYRRRGLGKEQLAAALERIWPLGPREITVVTGGSAFFLPARRMYAALGFAEAGRRSDAPPPETSQVAYRLAPQGRRLGETSL